MLTKQVTLKSLTRQECLLIWLYRKKLTAAEIARVCGVTRKSARLWLRAEHLPSYRIKQLLEMGIPIELLPKPLDMRAGQTNKNFQESE